MLFFHRELKCLVAFELKIGKFKPEYIGKMNYYLSMLDRTELAKIIQDEMSLYIKDHQAEKD